MQLLAILSYFCSMAWCIVFYNRYNRFFQKDKEQMTTTAVFLQFLFNFCLLGKYKKKSICEVLTELVSSWSHFVHRYCCQSLSIRNTLSLFVARICIWISHIFHRQAHVLFQKLFWKFGIFNASRMCLHFYVYSHKRGKNFLQVPELLWNLYFGKHRLCFCILDVCPDKT